MTSPSNEAQPVVVTMDDIQALFQGNPQVRLQVENIALKREIAELKTQLGMNGQVSAPNRADRRRAKKEDDSAKSG